nr:unnamed protein product [Digitaria exilis]
MVATSDYGDFHKMVKRFVMTSMLGTSGQALGEDVSSVYVEEFGKVISKEEIYQARVADMMMCAIEVDWRDFFPYLSWVPNRSFETRLLTAEVTEDHLPQLPYLNAVFHETLRRHSPVPLVPPRFVHENTNLGGYEVPAGTEIIINLYGCNMNKNEWDEPEEWKPERFLGGRFDTVDMYKTMAFGAGRRICAGSMQAINISCTAIARFVQDFAWRLKEGDEDKADTDTIQLTTNRLYPLHVYLTPRRRK